MKTLRKTIMPRLLIASFLLINCSSFVWVSLQPIDTAGNISFSIRNFGINTNGSLSGIKGTIEWDTIQPANSRFDVSVDVSTINTGIERRDRDLMKENYFNEKKYPRIEFKSREVFKDPEGGWNVTGALTIKGISKIISIPFNCVPSDKGYVFEGNFEIDRRDFDVGGNSAVLSDQVKVKLKVQTVSL